MENAIRQTEHAILQMADTTLQMPCAVRQREDAILIGPFFA